MACFPRALRAASTLASPGHCGVILVLLSLFVTCTSANARPLTVADSIETTRAMVAAPGGSPVFVSPDGKRYVVMLIRGDIKKNGVWMELLSGQLISLDEATRWKIVARFFTTALGAPNGMGDASNTLVRPTLNPPRWLEDNETVAFFWEDKSRVRQLVTANVRTGRVRYRTSHPSDVVDFGVSRGGRLLYSAKVEYSNERSQEMLRSGFAVRNADALSVLKGYIDDYSNRDRKENSERFISAPSSGKVRRLSVSGGGVNLTPTLSAPRFSPDERWALVEGSPSELPSAWIDYKSEILTSRLKGHLNNPEHSIDARYILQHFVVDAERATARPLWDAPLTPGATRPYVAWSPDSRSILVGPTFLPPARTDEAGRAGYAVAEVNVATGRYSTVPLSSSADSKVDGQNFRRATHLRWLSDDNIEVGIEGGEALRFERKLGGWLRDSDVATDVSPRDESPVRVELRQGLNIPPALYAVDRATRRERLVLDLNPALRTKFKLGRVEHVSWTDTGGRQWEALLYYPVDYQKGRRYPMVIQTRGTISAAEFSLTGQSGWQPGLGPGISVYAAQAIANRNIAVLQFPDQNNGARLKSKSDEPKLFTDAYVSAVDHFTERGLVNPHRIGLIGHSRGGWWVQYALTHSEFPFAAAIAADNMDGGYFQAALMSWRRQLSEEPNGASPFGDGLRIWLQQAPAFNADRVRTPLQLQVTSEGFPGAVMTSWEMFTRLRRLHKPVELYVIPQIEYGNHAIQNPQQCLASQQRAVDWWDFWLNEREDSDPTKADQYDAWRAMRSQSRIEADTTAIHP